MAERADRDGELQTPAVFIADQAWIGETEIRPQTIEPFLQTITETGSAAFWKDFNPEQGSQT